MSVVLPVNLDILREIAWSSDRQTCATLIRSCRFFYQEAAKRVLHDPVDICSKRDVRQFVRFLGPQPRARARYVRELHLGMPHLSAKRIRDLEDCISHMTRLVCLSFDAGEDFLESFPSLGDALAELTSLRRLRVHYAGSLTCDFLEALKSDLVSISLNWSGSDETWFAEQGMDDEEWATFHPVPLLAKWCASLEELKCENWYTASELPVFTDVYPNMRRLAIERDDYPLVAPYISAYPNLARLSVHTDHVDEIEYPEDVKRLRQHRALNIRSQKALDGPGTWQHLEEYVGSLVDLYLLGLTCHISRVGFSTKMEDCHLEMLSAVLSYAQPTHLNVAGDTALLGHPTHSLPVILSGSAASRLESLVLKIDLLEEDTPLNAVDALNELASALKTLPLRRLRLRVFDHSAHRDPTVQLWSVESDSDDSDSDSDDSEAPPHMRGTLRDLDIDTFKDGLTAELPLLTDAVVEFAFFRGIDRRRTIVPRHVHLPGACEARPGAYDPHLYEIR
ncbi:hypothetical protein C8T65DRAFT_832513 [Cerioporus squamosus]|nr:hypothetical protein C8T65DRAFT_832513 [Cerioporus squamosus]